MSDVAPSLGSWLRIEAFSSPRCSPLSREIARDARICTKRLYKFPLRVKQTGNAPNHPLAAVDFVPILSLRGSLLTQVLADVERLKRSLRDAKKESSFYESYLMILATDMGINDVTDDHLDVMLGRIPEVWRQSREEVRSAYSKLDTLTRKVKDVVRTLGIEPSTCSTTSLTKLKDTWSRDRKKIKILENALQSEKQRAQTTQAALRERVAQLEKDLSAQTLPQVQERFLNSRIKTSHLELPDKWCGDAILSIAAKPGRPNHTYTDHGSRDLLGQSLVGSKEIFYDAMTSLPVQSPAGHQCDRHKNDDGSSSSTWNKDSLRYADSLDAIVALANSDLDRGQHRRNQYKGGRAAMSSAEYSSCRTIVRSSDDLKPWCTSSDGDVELGSGVAGTVYLHKHTATHRPVALKVMSVPPRGVDEKVADSATRTHALQKIQDEMRILQRLGRLEWFPAFYGCFRIDRDTIGVAMEFCGDAAAGRSYSVSECMDGKGPALSNDDWLNVLLDVGDGMAVMHSKGILCNDLKEDNVLLVESDGEWRAKIIDFGWSSDIAKPPTIRFGSERKRAYQEEMEHDHIAPECALEGQPCSVSSDIYALGRLAAFVGQEMKMRDLQEYGTYIYQCPPQKRPTLKAFAEEITYLRYGTDDSSDSDDSQ